MQIFKYQHFGRRVKLYHKQHWTQDASTPSSSHFSCVEFRFINSILDTWKNLRIFHRLTPDPMLIQWHPFAPWFLTGTGCMGTRSRWFYHRDHCPKAGDDWVSEQQPSIRTRGPVLIEGSLLPLAARCSCGGFQQGTSAENLELDQLASLKRWCSYSTKIHIFLDFGFVHSTGCCVLRQGVTTLP